MISLECLPICKIKIKVEEWQKHKSDEKGFKSPSVIKSVEIDFPRVRGHEQKERLSAEKVVQQFPQHHQLLFPQ